MTIIYIDKIENATPEPIIKGKDVSDTMLVNLPFDTNKLFLENRVAIDTNAKTITSYDNDGEVSNVIDISGAKAEELAEQLLDMKTTLAAQGIQITALDDEVKAAQERADSAHSLATSAQAEAAANTVAVAANTALTGKHAAELETHKLRLDANEILIESNKVKARNAEVEAQAAEQKATRLDGELVVERGRIDVNEAAITTNEGNIQLVNQAVVAQSEAIGLLEAVDDEQQTFIETLGEAVETNEGEITSVKTTVTTHSTDILELQGDVAALDIQGMLRENTDIRVEDIFSSGNFTIESANRTVPSFLFKIDSTDMLSIDFAQVDAKNKILTGLKDGISPTDAATKAQLDAIDTKITEGSGLKPTGEAWDFLGYQMQNFSKLAMSNTSTIENSYSSIKMNGQTLEMKAPDYNFFGHDDKKILSMASGGFSIGIASNNQPLIVGNASGLQIQNAPIMNLMSALNNPTAPAVNASDLSAKINDLRNELPKRVYYEGELTWATSSDPHTNTKNLIAEMDDGSIYIGLHKHDGAPEQRIVTKGSATTLVSVQGTFYIVKYNAEDAAGYFLTNKADGSSWVRVMNSTKGYWYSVSATNSRMVESAADLETEEAIDGFYYATENDGVYVYNGDTNTFVKSDTYDLPKINSQIDLIEQDLELSKPITHYFTGETRLSYDFPNPNSVPADIQLFVLDTTQHIEASHIDLTDTDLGLYTGRYNSIGSHCIHDGLWTANSGHNAYKHISDKYYVVFDKSRFKWLIIDPENPHTSNEEQAIKEEVILGDRSQLPESFGHYVIATNFTDLDSLEFLSAVAAHQIDTINKKVIFDFNGAKPSGFVIIK